MNEEIGKKNTLTSSRHYVGFDVSKNIIGRCMKKVFLVLLSLIPSCFSSVKQEEVNDERSELFPLVELTRSTQMMQELVQQNKLAEFYDPEEWLLLRDNYSPARFAFDTEVFTETYPLAVVCFYKNLPDSKSYITQLKDLAMQYENQVKFVIIDADKLFSLAEWFVIQIYPSILFVKNREFVGDLEEDISIDALKQKLREYLV